MTKQADKATNKQGTGVAMPFAGMASLNSGMIEAYVQASQTLMTNALTINQELMRFAGERFQADIEALQTLSQCRNGQDMVSLQSDFAQTAAEAYQAEFSKLLEQNTEAATALSGGAIKE